MASAHPRLIFGGSTLGEDYKTLEEAQDILALAQSLGIHEVDTAALYPITDMGRSEKLLGEMQAIPKGIAVDTKILVLSKDANGTLEPDKIRTSLENSRKRLQLDSSQKLNIVHCHAPDYTTPIQDQAATLDELHKQGLFDKVGVSSPTGFSRKLLYLLIDGEY